MSKSLRRSHFAQRRRDPVTLILDVQYTPSCPFCLQPINARAVCFHRHLALCERCYRSGSRVSRRFWNRAIQLGQTAHFTSVANLIFFCPQSHWPSDLPLHQGLGLVELSPPTVKSHRDHGRTNPERPENQTRN